MVLCMLGLVDIKLCGPVLDSDIFTSWSCLCHVEIFG